MLSKALPAPTVSVLPSPQRRLVTPMCQPTVPPAACAAADVQDQVSDKLVSNSGRRDVKASFSPD